MFAVKPKRQAGFLNVDLDIESSSPLDLLAEDMGRVVTVLHCGPFGAIGISPDWRVRASQTPQMLEPELCVQPLRGSQATVGNFGTGPNERNLIWAMSFRAESGR